jgi:hypothetical protein
MQQQQQQNGQQQLCGFSNRPESRSWQRQARKMAATTALVVLEAWHASSVDWQAFVTCV